ncbi:MAG: hypothetical protein AB7O49_09510 [Sphingomonadales bacterium]
MTNARPAGTHWKDRTGRRGGRASILLVALPLLLLSLLIDRGATSPATEPRNGVVSGAGEASEQSGAQGKAQPAGRAGLSTADTQRTKATSSGTAPDTHGQTPAAPKAMLGTASSDAAGIAASAVPLHWPGAASPRAPPAAA